MSNYPTAPGCRCDAFDRVNGGYPMRQCPKPATSIVTIKDSASFCHARKVCDKHAAQLRQQAMIEILSVEPVQSESIPFDGVAPAGSPVGDLGEKGV